MAAHAPPGIASARTKAAVLIGAYLMRPATRTSRRPGAKPESPPKPAPGTGPFPPSRPPTAAPPFAGRLPMRRHPCPSVCTTLRVFIVGSTRPSQNSTLRHGHRFPGIAVFDSPLGWTWVTGTWGRLPYGPNGDLVLSSTIGGKPFLDQGQRPFGHCWGPVPHGLFHLV